MPIQLYATSFSPPCRAVWMALETLGLEYEWKETSPTTGATQTPEFLKLNPQHTVPVLVDDGLVLSESRAILLYLVRKYGKGKDLYPEADLETKARIEQRLFFEMGTVWSCAGKIILPVIRANKMYEPAALESLKEVLHWCEDFLKPTGFFAGTKAMSIADISFLALYASLQAVGLFADADFPVLTAWVERCKPLVKDYEKCNVGGSAMMGHVFQEAMKKIGGN